MGASALDRRRVREIELSMEAQAITRKATALHQELALVLHDLTGSLDGAQAEQRPLFPAVDVSRPKARAS